MIISGGGINVLDEHFPYVTEHDAVIDMSHMLSDALLLDFLREPILLECCLVAVCGFCVATSALALKRREEEKTG